MSNCDDLVARRSVPGTISETTQRGGVSELEYDASEPNGEVGGACHEDHRQERGIDSELCMKYLQSRLASPQYSQLQDSGPS